MSSLLLKSKAYLFVFEYLSRFSLALCWGIHTLRYDTVTLIPLVLQLVLRIGPIQRMGAN